MQHFLRDYVANFLSPTPFIGISFLVGMILLWRRKGKSAKVVLTVVFFLFVVFAYDPIPEILLNHYENRYPGFKLSSLDDEQKKKINYVVVLGGGFVPYEKHPLTTELTFHSLTRLVEGIRIHRELPGSTLIVSGKGWAPMSEAEAMKLMAVSLGVDEKKIIAEKESINTFGHTQHLKPVLGQTPFILVTSALHMPRAMGLFQQAGFSPIPAPTGHLLTGKYGFFNIKVPFAMGANLEAADLWFKEFWANLLAKLKGHIE
jgi:uncharacterized SAM-binding protein YcdF (DUF218 family)